MTDLHFDGFVLSRKNLHLERDGSAIKLEPRLADLLIFLVDHRDRVVSREELVESVWKGRFVSDSAISRAIYEIRRALGDDSQNSRYLRTVQGRGYQFIGEIEAEDVAIRPRRASPPWLLYATLSVIAIAVVIAMLTPTNGLETEIQLPQAATKPSPSTRLAFLPILADEHSPELRMIGISLTDLLYRRLHDTPGLAVRMPDYRSHETRSMDSLAAYARESGAEHLLSGTISAGNRADSVRISLELIDFRQGRPRQTPLGDISIHRPQEDEDLGEFLALRDAIVSRVLEVLEPALLPPDEDPTNPANFAAYRLFLLASQAILGGFCDSQGALDLLERSIARDPDYSPAWALLAVTHYNQVWACGASADHYRSALEASARATELAPSLPHPYFVDNLILMATGEVELAYERLQELALEHPNDGSILASELHALRISGFLRLAEERLTTLLEIDPLYGSTGLTGESPTTWIYLQDYDRFLTVLPDSDAAYHHFWHGLAEVSRGRPAEARRALEPAFRNHPAEIFARYSQALLATLEGDPRSARLILDEIVRQRSEAGANDGEMTFREAQLYALTGEREGALHRLEQALEQGFFCPRCIVEDPLFSPLRSEDRFRTVVAGATRRHRRFATQFGLEPDLP